ncbi:MAG: D12 class N6 adenine-specific DNA methyltransferase [Candidatus Nomurabacteria bacterium GW2011_GWD2_39_12]|uniref:site-specific DNA-methyltransferase (adenine-specific) n=1 Tax=Candidatus Nomurabacteria bacterium GW2011_GWD2_39_12 TaxID=1618759 RepID=A0A837HM79_9BACT|nr:MAG: D12 class N6 adenine-specific DNA methyltransferase [Candidatus Nomurabacteria bacterium GW2011_GWD2_39_12]
MGKLKDIPKIDRPRERFLQKGADALSKSDLLAILLGSGIKGKNVRELSESIIKKFGKNFLNITVDDLLEISGIGQAKALQITSAISLVKRFYADEKSNETIIKNSQDVLSLTYDLRDKKKEHLVCLYLNARSSLLKKEIVSVGLLDKTLLHPREIFYPATELNAASVILIHNHPSGDSSPSEKDNQIVEKIVQAGEIMGIPVIDFIIISENNHYSFYEKLRKQKESFDYVADGIQRTLFAILEAEKPAYEITAEKIQENYFYIPQVKENHIQLHNRRYIGNKHKLIEWIFSIINKECGGNSFADVFAGTGVVSAVATKHFKKILLNDFLHSNYIIYRAFFGKEAWDKNKIDNIIKSYNNIYGGDLEDNYFSKNFGGKFFSNNSAKIIGFIRENIEENKNNLTEREYFMLIASLLYTADKIANTVGHFDAYFKKDFVNDSFFMKPIDPIDTQEISIFQEDTNVLAKKIKADVVYIDPPYNSRQYSRFYHVLETLTKWDKPKLYGVALKPDPENMSDYCRANAKEKFAELVRDIDAQFLVVSYNNTYDSKSNSSKNKITLQEIEKILQAKGKTKVFEKNYKHFNAGNTNFNNHKEYLFVTKNQHE